MRPRPKRSQHDALRQNRQYAADGFRYIVDIDLSKFFDRVHYDLLMRCKRPANCLINKDILTLTGRVDTYDCKNS